MNIVGEYKNKKEAKVLLKNTLLLIGEQIYTNGAQKYLLINSTYQEIIDFLKNNDKHYYEHICGDRPINLYFDLDIKEEEQRRVLDETIKYFCSDVEMFLKTKFDSKSKPVILKSPSTETKDSFHIIFRIEGIYFDKPETLKILVAEFLEQNKKYKNMTDLAVYNANANMRTIYSSKMNYNNKKLVMYNDCEDIESFIQYCPDNNAEIITKKNFKQKKEKEVKQVIETPTLKDELIYLISKLNVKRRDEYNYWLNVAMILKSIDEEIGLEVLQIFSKGYQKYDKEKVENAYKNIKEDYKKYSIRDLIKLVELDNPLYEHKDNSFNNIYLSTLKPVDLSLSNFIYSMYKDKFVCVDIKNESFYFFNGYLWEFDENRIILNRKIRTEVLKKIENYCKILKDNDKDLIERLKGCISMIEKYQKLNHLPEVFYDKHFCDKLDNNKYLLGFDNGVYNLKEMKFVKGNYEDYVSMSAGWEYDPDYTETKIAEDFYKQVYPNEERRHYALKYQASCLEANNIDKKFPILTGQGDNAKTKETQNLGRVFGRQYCKTSPSSLLTKDWGASNGANSALIALKKCRLVLFSEPEANSKLQVGNIKLITSGEDEISARELHKQQETFKCSFKPMLSSNDIPELNTIDRAIIDRLIVLKHESHFCENPTRENEFLKNPDFLTTEEDINIMKKQTFNLLLKYYPIYKKEGIKNMPECVKEDTMAYIQDNELFEMLRIELIEDKDSVLLKKDVKNLRFKIDNCNLQKLYKTTELITKRFWLRDLQFNGERYKDCIKGWRVKEE